MGWDIATIGLKHKVDMSSVETIARFLVTHFHANVKCRILAIVGDIENDCEISPPMMFDGGTFECEGSTQNIDLVEYRGGCMSCRDSWELHFDWNPFVCYDRDNHVEITLYEDLVNLEFVECPFRWFDFLSNFVEHEADEESDAYCREALDKYRRCIREYARAFGCEKVMYIADQGPGEYILYQCARIDSDSLLKSVDGSYNTLDVPSFLSEGKEPVKENSDVGYLDVLFDDFSDISGI